MKRNKEQIIKEINTLIQELVSNENGNSYSKGKIVMANKKATAGCMGVLQFLIDDGFFAELKKIEEVLVKLEEEGEPYSRELVSMNLLNLVKKKVLRRIKRDNKWHYIIRK